MDFIILVVFLLARIIKIILINIFQKKKPRK